MEYYGCSDIAQFSLVFNKLTQENSTAVGFCCEFNPPGVPLRKTAKETLDELIGMRTHLVLRGGANLMRILLAQNVPITPKKIGDILCKFRPLFWE